MSAQERERDGAGWLTPRAPQGFTLGPAPAWGGYDGRWRDDGTRAEVFEARPGFLYLYTIEVKPELRGQRRGDRLLREICGAADRAGLALTLCPAAPTPEEEARLRRWYARHGFCDVPPNKYGQVGMARRPRARPEGTRPQAKRWVTR